MHSLGIEWEAELICFAETFLGTHSLAQKVAEETLAWWIESGHRIGSDHLPAFKIAGNKCLEISRNENSRGSGQLELFQQIQGGDRRRGEQQDLVEALIVSRLYRLGMPNKAGSLKTAGQQEEFMLLFVKETDEELRRIQWELIDLPVEMPGSELEEITSYLLGLQNEEKSLQLEKKCRSDPDWQRLKVWAGQLLRWTEKALSECHSTKAQSKVFRLENDRLVRLLARIESNETKPANSSECNDMSESKPTDTQPVQSKDYYLWNYLGVGLFLSLIGYFGWAEHREKEKTKPVQKLTAQSQQVVEDEKRMVLEQEQNLSTFALLEAQKQAQWALAQSTEEKILKMTETLGHIPDSLMPSALGIIENKKEPGEELAEKPAPLIKPIPIQWELLLQSVSGAFLFIPQGEALGKISVVDINESEIIFWRSEWNNKEKIFSLLDGEYEIRLDQKKHASLIFLGACQRRDHFNDQNQSIPADTPLYSLSFSKIWILGPEQKRTLIFPPRPDLVNPERVID